MLDPPGEHHEQQLKRLLAFAGFQVLEPSDSQNRTQRNTAIDCHTKRYSALSLAAFERQWQWNGNAGRPDGCRAAVPDSEELGSVH
jgi:hypothetical protein